MNTDTDELLRVLRHQVRSLRAFRLASIAAFACLFLMASLPQRAKSIHAQEIVLSHKGNKTIITPGRLTFQEDKGYVWLSADGLVLHARWLAGKVQPEEFRNVVLDSNGLTIGSNAGGNATAPAYETRLYPKGYSIWKNGKDVVTMHESSKSYYLKFEGEDRLMRFDVNGVYVVSGQGGIRLGRQNDGNYRLSVLDKKGKTVYRAPK